MLQTTSHRISQSWWFPSKTSTLFLQEKLWPRLLHPLLEPPARKSAMQLRTAWLESFEGLPPVENQPWINELHHYELYIIYKINMILYRANMDIQEPFLNGWFLIFSHCFFWHSYSSQGYPDDFKMMLQRLPSFWWLLLGSTGCRSM